MARNGAFACAERANQMANFLDPQQRSRALVQSPESQPNQQLLMATLAIEQGEGQVALAGVSLAPNQANGCGASYHAVSYVDLPCEQATAKHYPGISFKPMAPLKVSLAVLSKYQWVMSMPAGRGCVIQKEELVK